LNIRAYRAGTLILEGIRNFVAVSAAIRLLSRNREQRYSWVTGFRLGNRTAAFYRKRLGVPNRKAEQGIGWQ
jgi:hypothetical protein